MTCPGPTNINAFNKKNTTAKTSIGTTKTDEELPQDSSVPKKTSCGELALPTLISKSAQIACQI